LIRYKTGDIATSIEPCPCNCGLNTKTLQGLKGRAHDFIISPGGKFIHGQFLTHIIVYEPGIEKYQVIQKEIDSIDIKLVVGVGYDNSCQNRIRRAVQSYMGSAVKVRFIIVDDIPLTPAGKYRWIISELGTLEEHI